MSDPHTKRLPFFLTRLSHDQSGASAVILGLVMMAMMGFVGLGVEVSLHYMERREIQSATDSAALSGAYLIYKTDADEDPSTDAVRLASRNDASRNGYANGGEIAVDVQYPPTAGPQAGNSNAVRVVTTKTSTGLFASLFSQETISNATAATAFVPTEPQPCLWALDKDDQKTIDFRGTNTLIATGCGVRADSIAANAFHMNGTSSVSADYVRTVGGSVVPHPDELATIENSNQVIEGVGYLPNPYADLEAPVPSSCTKTVPKSGGTLTAGCYSEMDFSNGNAYTMQAGTYTVTGGKGFNVPNNAIVTGTEVTIHLTGTAVFNVVGSAILSAPKGESDPFENILVFMDSDPPGESSWQGGSSGQLLGVIYMPLEQLKINGNFSPGTGCTQVIVGSAFMSGGATSTINMTGCATLGYPELAAALRYPPVLVE